MFYSSCYKSPLGSIMLAANGDSLVGLWFENQKYFAAAMPDEIEEKEVAVLTAAKRWLDDYFDGRNPAITALPLAPAGSEFRHTVWKLLCEIPYGTVCSYGDIAGKIRAKSGSSGALSRAVGGAVGHNPISLIIPCHRVIGANGTLTGYAGGVDKKLELLKLEGVDTTCLRTPAK